MQYEEIRQLPALNSVIHETLRMYPSIHSITYCVRDHVVVPRALGSLSEDGSYVVPMGHMVLSSAAVSQVDPLLWRNSFE